MFLLRDWCFCSLLRVSGACEVICYSGTCEVICYTSRLSYIYRLLYKVGLIRNTTLDRLPPSRVFGTT